MKEQIKRIASDFKWLLLIGVIIVIILAWTGKTLEYITGELSLKIILVFLFGIFVGILLTIFEERWRRK